MTIRGLYTDSLVLLKELVKTPSFSREEKQTADIIEEWLSVRGLNPQRLHNNVWATNAFFDPAKPTLLLNSHHDTVKPTGAWNSDPFTPLETDDMLIGLGVNDAGGALVALIAAFRYFHAATLPFNIVFAASAEEEISGSNGIESLLPHLPPVDFALVGEPTTMQAAVAEKGLIVLDCIAPGKAGHAARDEGENAILNAMKDITWFSSFRFPKKSQWLGEVKMSVTIIQAGTQHNVVPAECRFTVDIRVTDEYTNDEILDIIADNVISQLKPHSQRLNPSGISMHHPLVIAAQQLGIELYGSPTLSDQALILAPSIKMGPGDSARSHTANEYILLSELQQGIEGYIQFIQTLSTLDFSL